MYALAWASDTEVLMLTVFTLLCLVPSLLLDACACDRWRTLEHLYKDDFQSFLLW